MVLAKPAKAEPFDIMKHMRQDTITNGMLQVRAFRLHCLSG